MLRKILFASVALAFMAGGAFAADTPNPVTPGYQVCSNSSGSTICGFVPVDASHPLPVAMNATPVGATPLTGVFSGADTTTAAATLTGATGKTTYICGFTVSGLGSTAGGPVTVTVATLAGSNTLSYSYVFAASATTPNTPLAFNYSPCLPASAAGASITVTVPGEAGNTATQINASGYRQ